MSNRSKTIRAAAVISLSIVLSGFVSACSSRRGDETDPTLNPTVKWYLGCWNAFNQKKWDQFKSCYADNATSQQVGYGKASVTAPDAILTASQDLAKTFPDIRGDALLVLVNGSRVASILLLNGTNTGPILGPNHKELPTTNNKLGQLIGHYVETEGGAPRITREIGALDSLTMAHQLGFLKTGGRDWVGPGGSVFPPTETRIAKNDDTERKNLDIAKAKFEAWNRHDGGALEMPEADDYIYHDLPSPADRNKLGASELNKAYWDAFSDAKVSSTSSWAAGEFVVTVGTFEGKNDGDFPAMNLKKTGKQVSLPHIDFLRFDGGKIKEEWLFFDGASLLNQLK
jgi:predicted ester cyclase